MDIHNLLVRRSDDPSGEVRPANGGICAPIRDGHALCRTLTKGIAREATVTNGTASESSQSGQNSKSSFEAVASRRHLLKPHGRDDTLTLHRSRSKRRRPGGLGYDIRGRHVLKQDFREWYLLQKLFIQDGCCGHEERPNCQLTTQRHS